MQIHLAKIQQIIMKGLYFPKDSPAVFWDITRKTFQPDNEVKCYWREETKKAPEGLI